MKLSILWPIIVREMSLALKGSGNILYVLGFFVISVSLFPFALGAAPDILHQVNQGVIWVAALLASMLAISRMFEEDYEDGTLAQLILQGAFPEKIVLAKIIAHWLITGVPLVLISPLLGI